MNRSGNSVIPATSPALARAAAIWASEATCGLRSKASWNNSTATGFPRRDRDPRHDGGSAYGRLLDMADRFSSTPLKGTMHLWASRGSFHLSTHRLERFEVHLCCGGERVPKAALSKEAGSGTCFAIDWASRETTRPGTGSLCLTARNQVRDHLHVRADGMSRLAIHLAVVRSTGKPTRCRPLRGCPAYEIPRATCLPQHSPRRSFGGSARPSGTADRVNQIGF